LLLSYEYSTDASKRSMLATRRLCYIDSYCRMAVWDGMNANRSQLRAIPPPNRTPVRTPCFRTSEMASDGNFPGRCRESHRRGALSDLLYRSSVHRPSTVPEFDLRTAWVVSRRSNEPVVRDSPVQKTAIANERLDSDSMSESSLDPATLIIYLYESTDGLPSQM
jgi:hypothetical protein